MEGLQNTLKEVDLQIIYRRLEARKRDITRDGQMSKQQIASAYRGYHGLENQYHALTQMSNQALTNAKLKNDHLHSKHVEDMKILIDQEKVTRDKNERNLKVMRDDFTAQLAYQYVYKMHSFKRYYKSQQQSKKPRPTSDKPELYEQQRKTSTNVNAPRPLGSLREMDLYRDELKFKFPPILNDKDIISPRVNAMEGKTYEALRDETKDTGATMTSFPNIENAMGIDVKFKYKHPLDDRNSIITAPPAGLHAESDDENTSIANLVPLDMGQTLMQMRKKEQERNEKSRVLPPTPKTKKREERKESWKRILPDTPKRQTTVYPDDFKLKKVMRKEVTDVMDTWARYSKRGDEVKLAKDHHKLALADNPIPVFDKSRPTSAILKDFRDYKKKQSEQEDHRKTAENEQVIIVRQMSPQPRVGSPVAQSRNEFMIASRAVIQRDNSNISIVNTGRLRRTDSEKFPSVSRTSSYRDVLDESTGLHENALLTAAERIELEKRMREESSNDTKAEESNSQTTLTRKRTRRKLPVAPTASNAKSDSKDQTATTCKTTLVNLDTDVTTIDKVKLANITQNEADRQSNKREENPYVPAEYKPINIDSLVQLPVDPTKRIKEAGAACGKEFWPRLNKTINFNYESYSRTTSDTKRRLDIRAKNRRKIQQKNAQMKDEKRLKKKYNQTDAASVSERPSTRVSFNENVVVFKTI